MSDIEKYGLFAVLFVGGILLLIAVGGGFSDEPEAAALPAGTPVVLDRPAALRAPDGGGSGLQTVHVSPLLPTDKPWSWSEPPVVYPGERSSSAPPAAAAGSPPESSPASSVVLQSPVTPASSSPGTYVIREGDTLADVARKYLGSSTKWDELVRLNPGLDPKRLKIGQTIRLSGSAPSVLSEPVAAPAPAASKPVAAATPAGKTHKVSEGDTLGAIAKKYLGSSTKADALFEANRDVLKNPDALKVGQVLRIP